MVLGHKATPDVLFLTYLTILLIVGSVVLASATLPVGFERYNDGYHFLKSHLLKGVLPGAVAFCITMALPSSFWQRTYKLWAIVTLLLLSLVFIPGIAAQFGTTKSWIQIGSYTMQPAEFAKFTFVVTLAGWLGALSLEKRRRFTEGLVPFLIFFVAIAVLLVLQPDIGTLIIFGVIGITVYFVAGLRIAHFVALVAGSAAGVIALVVSAPYRLARIMTLLHPASDIQGAGYQLTQALIAIGSGGLFGLGLGHSRQKFLYLPEVSSDSIFAVLAEELGFAITVAILLLIVLFFLRGIHIARRAHHNESAQLLVVAVMVWYGIQTLINICAIVGIIPLTGVPLPFVSHGGSAIIALLAGMGIVVSVSKQSRS